jgi:hypothetical protein
MACWRRTRRGPRTLSGWGSHSGGPTMTEYTVKDIGHQRIVYADRQSIGVCANEDSALKLIAEHSAANCAARRSTVQGREPRGLGRPATLLIASGLKPGARRSRGAPSATTRQSGPGRVLIRFRPMDCKSRRAASEARRGAFRNAGRIVLVLRCGPTRR